MIRHHPQELKHQALNNLKIKVKFMVTIKFLALIKGENKVEKLKKLLHKFKMMMMDPFNLNHKCLIQEFIKAFNRIIPLIIFLEVVETLNDLNSVIAMQKELNNFTRNKFSRIMTKMFKMSMIGELKFFLGFQVKQMKEGTFICQTKYVKDMLKKFDVADAKPIKTLMALNGHLDLDEEGKSVD
ncbi:uncharacterized protein LOC112897241 [Panicum hallii]|uniref:uncharacterized protein LOC112897241 n=1 Tax=Panicum hallii TaxID=206008 RepID=UPI000DF4D2A0|nr:uncharacterized protein LOC112897241 [Panicum hallii]